MSRASSLAVMWAAYLWTIVASVSIGAVLPVDSPLVKAGIVDLVATVMIFAISVIFNNSSIYDPYWSVAPMILTGYWVVQGAGGPGVNHRALIVMFLVTVWGVRLTANFLIYWKGMHHEDWRYADFRERAGALYWVVSFFGFHLVPTVIVFSACVPVYFACTTHSQMGLIDGLAIAVTAGAIVIETAADRQMRTAVARAETGGTTFREGLWAYSRHPNYFGEMVFWWGIYLFALGADLRFWWTIIGPLGVTILFVAVSLPLIETRMTKRRSDYRQVREEVSILIPWFSNRR